MNKNVFNIGNNRNEKLQVASLKIGNNVMIYNGSFVTLKNITGVSLGREPKKGYSPWWFAFPIIGIFLLFSSKWQILSGLIFILMGVYFIYNTYKSNQNPNEFLMFHLNSGKTLYMGVPRHDFAIQVMDTIINCINSNEGVRIDFRDCTIREMQIEENHM